MPCFENAGRSVVEHEELCEDLICRHAPQVFRVFSILNVPFLTQKLVHYRHGSEILFLRRIFSASFFSLSVASLEEQL